jgi:hypothetical protein
VRRSPPPPPPPPPDLRRSAAAASSAVEEELGIPDELVWTTAQLTAPPRRAVPIRAGRVDPRMRRDAVEIESRQQARVAELRRLHRQRGEPCLRRVPVAPEIGRARRAQCTRRRRRALGIGGHDHVTHPPRAAESPWPRSGPARRPQPRWDRPPPPRAPRSSTRHSCASAPPAVPPASPRRPRRCSSAGRVSPSARHRPCRCSARWPPARAAGPPPPACAVASACRAFHGGDGPSAAAA